MKLWRWIVSGIASGIVIVLLAACSPSSASPAQIASTPLPFETPGPLDKTARYWDLGVSIQYPVEWAAPQYSSGQMILSRVANPAADAAISSPVVAIDIVDIKQLNLAKDASLQQILAALTLGPNVTIREGSGANFAGLDAAYMSLTDSKKQVNGYALAFRMPDGRVGSMIAIAPIANWANIVTTFEQMRLSSKLLKPSDFQLPAIGSETAVIAAGGISFTQPNGWVGRDFQTARIFHDRNMPEYVDGSGYVNGPQLILRAQYLDKGAVIRDALTKFVSVQPEDTVSSVMVGGQPGVQIHSTDAATGQVVDFIAFTSQDKSVMIVFRWSTPGILIDATRPLLDAMLQSVRYGPITTPILLQPGPVRTATP